MAFTNAQLAQKMSDLIGYWSAFATEYSNWLGGTVGGGPGFNGSYPLTDWAGTELLVESPAKLADTVSGLVASSSAHAAAALVSENAADASETAAALSAATATAQAVLADADRVAAELAETNASNSAVTATAQANNAIASAAAALISENAASASAAAALISETAAAASAVLAATFDPALFVAKATGEYSIAYSSNISQFARFSGVQDMSGTSFWDEGIYGGHSGMTNGPTGMTYDPFIVAGSGSDVRAMLVLPRTDGRGLAYKGQYSGGAAQTAWHYAPWSLTAPTIDYRTEFHTSRITHPTQYLTARRGDSTGGTGVRVQNSAGVNQGYLFGDGSQTFGLLNNAGAWALQIAPGSTQVTFPGDVVLNGDVSGTGVQTQGSPPGNGDILRAHTNGYVYAGWINTVSGATTSDPSRIYTNNGGSDAFLRYMTPSAFIDFLQGEAWDFEVTPSFGGPDTNPGALKSALSANMLHIDGKEVIDGNDGWLRINQNADFPNGIYSPGRMRADSGFIGNTFTRLGSSAAPAVFESTTAIAVPNSTKGADQIHFYPWVRQGAYNSNTTTETGYGQIMFPSGSLADNIMGTLEIHGYNYASSYKQDGKGGAWAVKVSGYWYASENWANTTVEILYGRPPFDRVRLGEATSNKYIILGESSTVWNHPQIIIRNVTAGYSSQDMGSEAWGISINATLPSGWTVDGGSDGDYYVGGKVMWAEEAGFNWGGKMSISTSAASGGSNGDIHYQY